MAEDRTLLAFISEGERGRARANVYQLLGDQFVNSVLIRTRLASGTCFSETTRDREDGREKGRERERDRQQGYEDHKTHAGVSRLTRSEFYRKLIVCRTLHRKLLADSARSRCTLVHEYSSSGQRATRSPILDIHDYTEKHERTANPLIADRNTRTYS